MHGTKKELHVRVDLKSLHVRVARGGDTRRTSLVWWPVHLSVLAMAAALAALTDMAWGPSLFLGLAAEAVLVAAVVGATWSSLPRRR